MNVVLGIVIGAFLTFAGSYYLFVLQRRRKMLGYQVMSANVVIPFETQPEDALQVVVKAALVDEAAVSGGSYIAAGKVYGFRVRLRNTGNETVEGQTVFVELDDEAKIIAVRAEQAPAGMPAIILQRDERKPNTAKCGIPYLNEGEELIVSIQSVKNESMKCRVIASGPGLRTQDLAAVGMRNRNMAVFIAAAGIAVFVGAGAVGVQIYGLWSDPGDILVDVPRGPLVVGGMVVGSLMYMGGSIISMIMLRRLRGI